MLCCRQIVFEMVHPMLGNRECAAYHIRGIFIVTSGTNNYFIFPYYLLSVILLLTDIVQCDV
jgi:hypothetical protein